MLFNSYVFIFLFLPVTCLVYWVLVTQGHMRIALSWLVAASLFYYGWWNPNYVPLLIFSILVNYALGIRIAAAGTPQVARGLLVLGIAFNLGLLAYFKYTNFLVDNLNALFDASLPSYAIILPLGISFFTFQKVAYLVDVMKRRIGECDLLRFSFFVCFFPQLLAGPIVHFREVIPQLGSVGTRSRIAGNIAVGATMFGLGLFKKVVIADTLAVYATRVFRLAEAGETVTFVDGWIGALAFTLQLYFDFSGYSDMALGAARLFGIRLPVNFYSPYKAVSIIDFWRRWHITLSRFLRDYLYIPLGGNRRGPVRRGINVLVTMLLGGLWHGASWNFVLWGGLHGVYLLINHAWRASGRFAFPAPVAWLLTFVAVVLAWVPFRAETLHGTQAMLAGMLGFHGFVLPPHYQAYLGPLLPLYVGMGGQFGAVAGFGGLAEAALVLGALAMVLGLPTTQQWLTRFRPALRSPEIVVSVPRGMPRALLWAPRAAWALLLIALNLVTLYHMTGVSEFLYYQF